MQSGQGSRWWLRVPNWIVALWVMYVVLFTGGFFVLTKQQSTINQAVTYTTEDILWDISQLEHALIRLQILLERDRSSDPDEIVFQVDLAGSNLDRLEQDVSRIRTQPYAKRKQTVAQLRTLLLHLEDLLRQPREAPTGIFAEALSKVTQALLLAHQIMAQVHQDSAEQTTVISETLTSFRRYWTEYAIGLTLLVVLLTYMTLRHMRSERALWETERRFRTVLENVYLLAVGIDAHGRITFCNDYLLQLTGWQREEVLGQDWFDVFLPSNLRENMRQQFLTDVLAVHYEHEIVTRHGGRRLISWNTTALRDTQGRLAGLTSIGEDITERKRAREALQKAHDELDLRVRRRTTDLEAANASLRQEIDQRQRLEEELLKVKKLESVGLLAGGIAHDFNNILTAVLGNISLAKMSANPQEPLFARLARAETACQRAIDLTQQLLTFSKGGAPIRRPVSMPGLIKESASFVLRGSKARYQYTIPDDLWPAEIDEGQISQVISNIVINANQAMPQGGVVHIRAENVLLGPEHALPLAPGKYIRVSITDQGTGIPAEHLHKIFDPYFTTKPHGSGLGLATAYAIMQKHDGYIAVESAAGEGTTFAIYLPASEKNLPPVPETSKCPVVGSGRVLVMDDEESIRELAEYMLTRIGYDVETACDGAKAIELYTRARAAGRPFDVVIMDLTIPGGMGGKEAIQQLLKLDPQTKAIVSSGYSTDPVMAHFRPYGFRGMVTKPYSIEEISAILHRVIADEVSADDANPCMPSEGGVSL